MAGSKLTAQACDGCRVRKVKCDGLEPCSACAQFSVRCVKSQAPKRRKNPVRGRLLAQVRGDSGSVAWPGSGAAASGPGALPTFSVSLSPSSPPLQQPQPPAPGVALGSSSVSPPGPGPGPGSGPDPPGPPSIFSASPVTAASYTYTPDFFRSFLADFETLVYPFSPAFSPDDIAEAISSMYESVEDLALVHAYAAVTTFLSRTSDLHQGERWTQFVELVQQSLQVYQRATLTPVDVHGSLAETLPCSLKRIMTCIYLEISMMGFRSLERSFTLIREAISLIHVLEARIQTYSLILSPKDTLRFHQLYWEAYIHERYLTMAAAFPSILPPIEARLSTTDLGTPDHIQLGFNCLVELFLVLDERFMRCYNVYMGLGGAPVPVTSEWIEKKQAQLDDVENQAINVELRLLSTGQAGLSERQHADLFITRLWLRTVLWQVALSQGLLSSSATHEGLSLQFPASRLATQLRNLVNRLNSILSIATQGSGIVRKLFDIASTVGDVLALPGADTDKHNEKGLASHVEDFVYVVHFLLELEEMRENEKGYLREKSEFLQQRHGIGIRMRAADDYQRHYY